MPYREYMLQRLISLTLTSWPNISHHRPKLKRIVQQSLDLFCKTYPSKIPLFCATCLWENLDLSFHGNGLVKCLLLCILCHIQGYSPPPRAIADRFVCHGLKKDVKKWCKQCHSCQAAKIQRHTKAPLFSRLPPAGRFLSLHVDLVEPLPPSEGMTYLFTVSLWTASVGGQKLFPFLMPELPHV